MKRWLISFLLAAFVGISSFAATIEVVSSESTIEIGSSVTVSIEIIGSVDLYAFQFDVTFFPTVLSAADVTDGGFLGSGLFFSGLIDNSVGTITLISDSLIGPVVGVSGDGVLATLRFLSTDIGTSDIQIENIILLDSQLGDIDVTAGGTSVTVMEVSSDVPEPGAWTLSLVGFIVLGVKRKVSKKDRYSSQ